MKTTQIAGKNTKTKQDYKDKTDRIKLNVKITDYLQKPDKPELYCVPWRSDITPSLSVFRHADGIQLAMDKGRNEPAMNVISLCARIEGVSFTEALFWLEPENGSPSKKCSINLKSNGSASGKSGGGAGGLSPAESKDCSGKEKPLLDMVSKPVPVRTNKPLAESRYLKYKKLGTPPAWLAEPLDMFVDSERNLCYSTLSGSIHRKGDKVKDASKNRTWATWTGSADAALVLPDGVTSLYVYEGIGNALAWAELHGTQVGMLILSSAGLNRKGINALLAAGVAERVAAGQLTMNLVLDADDAGDTATAAIVESFPAARDLRGFYGLEKGVDFLDVYDLWRGVSVIND